MDCRQEEIVTGLLKSYQEIGGINHLDCANLPSKHVIATLCDDLLHLLFPGFYSEEAVSSEELPLAANELVANVRSRLSEEIGHSLRYKNGNGSGSQVQAQDYCCKFLATLPDVRRLLQTDVEAAYEGDPAARSFAKDEKGNPVKGIKRHPNVEDNVTIYPNVTILGGDTTIGARSTIGANVFLMHSIDPDTLLAVGDQDFRMLDKSKKRKT